MTKTCKNCPAFIKDDQGQGFCRANPPEIQEYKIDGVTSAWPPVHQDAWCYFGKKLMRWRLR